MGAATHIKTSMTDKQFLEREISEWMASPERKAHCVNMVDDCENIVKELLKTENLGILK